MEVIKILALWVPALVFWLFAAYFFIGVAINLVKSADSGPEAVTARVRRDGLRVEVVYAAYAPSGPGIITHYEICGMTPLHEGKIVLLIPYDAVPGMGVTHEEVLACSKIMCPGFSFTAQGFDFGPGVQLHPDL